MSTVAQDRAKVLSRIRTALGVETYDTARNAAVRDRLERHPRGTIPARARQDREALLRLFSEMLVAQGAEVVRSENPDGTVNAIAAYLAGNALPSTIRMSEEPVLAALPWVLAPAITVGYGVAGPSDQVSLSRAIAGAAETGTLMLVSGVGNPISLNFLPETHIVLISAGDIVGSYEEGFDRLRATYGQGTLPRTVNWISGPSRTADIEQTIVRGAHGPKRLLVVIQG